ncbi:hypothetical protein, partial [Brevibacillus invocatus]|uniref:hypothetical protein n=1 Tax=Brevibacillus invocatus TaxID=173959 RepID=UPI0039A0CABC
FGEVLLFLCSKNLEPVGLRFMKLIQISENVGIKTFQMVIKRTDVDFVVGERKYTLSCNVEHKKRESVRGKGIINGQKKNLSL